MTSTQLPPTASHRRHWYANEVGVFDHEPVDALSAFVSCAVPVTAGAVVLTGAAGGATGSGTTTLEAALVADVEPTEFEALTTTRSVRPTSPATST